jgi:hypothetical protein
MLAGGTILQEYLVVFTPQQKMEAGCAWALLTTRQT